MAGNAYASEKNAYGNCDRCGFRYKLTTLRKERENLNQQNLRVCTQCWDADHPQNKLGRIDHSDSQGLRDARPQLDLVASRTGDSIVEKFTSDITGWDGTGSTVSHDSTNGYMNASWTGETNPNFFYNSYSFDPSVYVNVRIRFSLAMIDISSFSGKLFWARSTDSFTYADARSVAHSGIRPMRSMGDPFVELIWKLNGLTDWDGTISGLSFELYSPDSTTGAVNVDWVRIEKAIV